MSTATKTRTHRLALDQANPQDVADLLRAMALGSILAPLKVVIAGLGAAVAVDITSAAVRAAATITGALSDLPAGQGLPPILSVTALRVVGAGGGNKPGIYVVTDKDGTPYDAGATAVGVATLSDDGKTLTFNAQVTAITLWYIPRPAVDMASKFPAATVQ